MEYFKPGDLVQMRWARTDYNSMTLLSKGDIGLVLTEYLSGKDSHHKVLFKDKVCRVDPSNLVKYGNL